MTRRLVPAALACLVVVAGALAGPATGRAAGIGVRLVPRTADVRDPLARTYIVERLAPGTSVVRQVQIQNGTDAVADVTVYTAAASLDGGQFSFAAAHDQDELSSWTSVNRRSWHLPAGSDVVANVTVDVPADASPGERYAVVWAEVSTHATAGGGVTLVNRVGVRMYVSIGPGGAPAPSFALDFPTAYRSDTGAPLVVVRIRNTGKRTLDVVGTLSLADGPGGLRAGPIAVELAPGLSPGASQTAMVALDPRLPSGPWRARLQVDDGFTHHSAAATITFPRLVPASLKSAPDNRELVAALLVVALLATIAAAVPYRRRPQLT